MAVEVKVYLTWRLCGPCEDLGRSCIALGQKTGNWTTDLKAKRDSSHFHQSSPIPKSWTCVRYLESDRGVGAPAEWVILFSEIYDIVTIVWTLFKSKTGRSGTYGLHLQYMDSLLGCWVWHLFLSWSSSFFYGKTSLLYIGLCKVLHTFQLIFLIWWQILLMDRDLLKILQFQGIHFLTNPWYPFLRNKEAVPLLFLNHWVCSQCVSSYNTDTF